MADFALTDGRLIVTKTVQEEKSYTVEYLQKKLAQLQLEKSREQAHYASIIAQRQEEIDEIALLITKYEELNAK